MNGWPTGEHIRQHFNVQIPLQIPVIGQLLARLHTQSMRAIWKHLVQSRNSGGNTDSREGAEKHTTHTLASSPALRPYVCLLIYELELTLFPFALSNAHAPTGQRPRLITLWPAFISFYAIYIFFPRNKKPLCLPLVRHSAHLSFEFGVFFSVAKIIVISFFFVVVVSATRLRCVFARFHRNANRRYRRTPCRRSLNIQMFISDSRQQRSAPPSTSTRTRIHSAQFIPFNESFLLLSPFYVFFFLFSFTVFHLLTRRMTVQRGDSRNNNNNGTTTKTRHGVVLLGKIKMQMPRPNVK